MSKSPQPVTTLRRVRRAALTAVGVLLIVTATPMLGSGADFTGQASIMGNSVSTATLTAPTGPAVTTAGLTDLSLGWDAAPVAAGTAVDYTVQRSLSALGDDPATVYSGADLATTDAGGLAGVLAGKAISSLSSGDNHSCVIADGAAYCWGSNGAGQLGDGTTTRRTVPTLVGGALARQTVTALSAGTNHTCAIASGVAYCWGNNDFGQLGDNTTTRNPSPVAVTGALAATSPTQINAGNAHSCAIAADRAYCWGANSSGELGDGTRTTRLTSALVGGALATQPVTAIRPSYLRTCAIAGGAAYCWGNNSSWLLSVSTYDQYVLTPSAVVGLPAEHPITSISSANGAHCAVAGAIVYCWGGNGSGQLGSGTTSNRYSPIALGGALTGHSASAVTVGQYSACAIADGMPYCWGYNNGSQLGDGGTETQLSPVAAATSGALSGRTITEVSAGISHSCAISDGAGYCWGANGSGQLGNGASGAASRAPTSVSASAYSEWVCPAGAVLTDTTCSLTPDTTYYYQLVYTVGQWTAPSSGWLPVATTAPAAAGAPSRGAASTSTALSVDWPDASWGAGIDPSYTLQRSLSADGSDPTTVYNGVDLMTTDAGGFPAQVQKTLSGLTTGANHSCVLADDAAYCWGSNINGQIGDGSQSSYRMTPVAVSRDSGISGFTAISAGTNHTCAIADGLAYCWGSNSSGQLGDGSTTSTRTPVAVQGIPVGATISAISAGTSHTCALASGTAYCWGDNRSSQLGNGVAGAPGDRLVATPVQADLFGDSVTAISASLGFTCAIAAGTAYCWGFNGNGQLGIAAEIGATQSTPAVVRSELPASTVTAIATGMFFSCAIAAEKPYCWGTNSQGQLGDTTRVQRGVPGLVSGDLAAETVTAGANHVCITAADMAHCWGYNYRGQLGDGTAEQRYSPVPVNFTSIDEAETTIAGGDTHSCGITANTVYCWGGNGYGQLGNSPSTPTRSPTPVVATAYKVQPCAPGAVQTGSTCSLTPGTTYYYQLSYTAAGFTPASSGFTGLTTIE